MATRGWDGVTATDIARLTNKQQAVAKPSKYRNQRVEVDGLVFDSKREAAHWLRLKALEHTGEIHNLSRQVPFPLYCPIDGSLLHAEVARYVADFVYYRGEQRFVVDAKSHRTRNYTLKRKWLELQSGIVIEEV